MANQKQRDLLSSGKTLWNTWRRDYAEVQALEPDLHGADLHGIDLRRFDLHGADLTEANLQGADLREADLREADLRNANLRSTNLSDANLLEANVRWADVRGATLCRTNLKRVDQGRVNTSCLMHFSEKNGRKGPECIRLLNLVHSTQRNHRLLRTHVRAQALLR
jgi:uncharacterized protein YjbI with pentapeptide repeats